MLVFLFRVEPATLISRLFKFSIIKANSALRSFGGRGARGKERTLVGRFNGRKNWPCIITQFFPRFLRLLITVQFLGSQDVQSLVVKKDGRTMRNGTLFVHIYIYIIISIHVIY